MQPHKIASHDEWLAARKAHLAEEKAFTRARDALSRKRRELPWEKVENNYVFDGPNGKETLAELFGKNSQLVIYHFMLGPDWEEGCPSCSLLADHFDGMVTHLAQRDVAFVVVSRAPLPQIEAFKRRMGWHFKWVSSFGDDFNYDYQVSFTPQEQTSGTVTYNYRQDEFPSEEAPGASVFHKSATGELFHTYSARRLGYCGAGAGVTIDPVATAITSLFSSSLHSGSSRVMRESWRAVSGAMSLIIRSRMPIWAAVSSEVSGGSRLTISRRV